MLPLAGERLAAAFSALAAVGLATVWLRVPETVHDAPTAAV
jgi:hypothetical protein